MVYDQAQSPRLGQRVPVESTYVQIFDVDPDTPTVDLVEAAWPGQLVFRQDRSILQIYDGDADAWADVAGGVAGQLTYVGSTEPTDGPFQLGDLWYDTANEYQAHVWNGTAWIVSSVPATNVTGGTFGEDISLNARLISAVGPLGQRVEMSQDGLKVFSPNAAGTGSELSTFLASDGTETLKGEAVISRLTVTDAATLRQTQNQVARGGVLSMAQGVTAPGSAPTVNMDWAQVPLSGFDFTNHVVRDLCWDAALSRWLVFVTGLKVGDTLRSGRSLMFRADGSFDAQQGGQFDYTAGGIVAGTRIGGIDNYYLWSPGGSDFELVNSAGILLDFWPLSSSSVFSMAVDPSTSDIVVAEYHTITGSPRVQLQRFNTVSAGANLVANGDFEANITGWSASNVTLTRNTNLAEVIAGTGSLQAVTGTTAGTVTSTKFNVLGHTRYVISGRLKSMAANQAIKLQILWYDASNAQLSGTANVQHTSTSGVTSYDIDVVAPPNATKASLQWVFAATAGRFIIDDCSCTVRAGFNYVAGSGGGTDELQVLSATSAPADGLYIGNGDFGAKYYVLASSAGGNQGLVFTDSTKAEDLTRLFPLPVIPLGIGYDGTSFWTLGNDLVLYRHEGGNKFTTEPASWYAATTYRDTVNGYQTVLSPATTFTMKRRARLTITTAPINITGSGDPNAIGYYLDRSATIPAPSSYNFQANSITTSLVVTAANFTGAAPPTTSNFPNANPALVRSAAELPAGDPLIQLWGDGSGRLGEASWDTAGIWTPDFGGAGGGLATPSITMRRTSSAGTAIPDSTVTVVPFANAQESQGGITYNTSPKTFVVPEDGTYLLASGVFWAPPGGPSSGRHQLIAQVNGVTVAVDDRQLTTNFGITNMVTTTKTLAAGDAVSYAAFQQSGGSINLNTTASQNWASVTRVDGVKGDTGAAGIDGTAISLEFAFATPATTWTINHGLGTRNLWVQAFDTTGVLPVQTDIEYTTVDQINIFWFYATAGLARILG